MSIIEVKVPDVSESITEVTLAQWLVEDGDYVEMDQAICELETDKASQEIYAEKGGTVQFVAEEGDDLPVGALLAKLDTSAEAPAGAAKEAPKAEPAAVEAAPAEKKEAAPAQKAAEKTAAPTANYATGTPSPAARKLIEENGLDSARINGSGKNGRITKADVLQAIESGTATMQDAYGALANAAPAFSREEKTERLSRLRKTVSERLVFAKNSTAMLTTFNEVNMQPVMDLRAKYKEKFKETHGVSLGFMSFFTRACCLAMQKVPAVNAYIDVEAGQVIYHDYVDISIAVSTPKGLVVPVIRNAESLTLAGIESKVKELAIKGRDGELSMDEMTGGTFTISNGGVFGSLMSTPIINPPQSAILGMHKIEERAVVENGQVVVRPMMYVALSYDHRIIDGKESVGWLVAVKDYLENPEKMLLGEDPVQLLLNL